MLALLEPCDEIVYLRYPEGLSRPVIMNTNKGQEGALVSGSDSDFKGAAGFCAGSELVTNRFLDRKAGENSHAILAALKVHECSETMMHPQKISEECSLVDAPGASASVVDLLKSYQIWFERAQNGRDSPEVHLVVHAAAVLYVVGHQPYFRGFLCLKRRCAREKSTGEEKECDKHTGKTLVFHSGAVE